MLSDSQTTENAAGVSTKQEVTEYVFSAI